MINLKTRKRFNRIISGLLSAAMVMTMVPDIWLPVYADSVRKDILNADIGIVDDGEIITDNFVNEEDVQPEVYAMSDDRDEIIKYEYNGHTYAVINIAMKWSQAKEYCENLGGHLATITDIAENDFITELTYSSGSYLMYWVGGCRDGAESEWK